MNDKTVEEQLNDILKEYEEGIKKLEEKSLRQAAQTAKKELKSSSPKNTGKYAASWAYKKTENGYIIYNKKYAWKTHLLENGHVIRNQVKGGRTYGRINGIKHIEPAAEKGAEKLIKDIEKGLDKL